MASAGLLVCTSAWETEPAAVVAPAVATDYYMLRETHAEVVIIEQTEKELQRGCEITCCSPVLVVWV